MGWQQIFPVFSLFPSSRFSRARPGGVHAWADAKNKKAAPLPQAHFGWIGEKGGLFKRQLPQAYSSAWLEEAALLEPASEELASEEPTSEEPASFESASLEAGSLESTTLLGVETEEEDTGSEEAGAEEELSLPQATRPSARVRARAIVIIFFICYHLVSPTIPTACVRSV